MSSYVWKKNSQLPYLAGECRNNVGILGCSIIAFSFLWQTIFYSASALLWNFCPFVSYCTKLWQTHFLCSAHSFLILTCHSLHVGVKAHIYSDEIVPCRLQHSQHAVILTFCKRADGELPALNV